MCHKYLSCEKENSEKEKKKERLEEEEGTILESIKDHEGKKEKRSEYRTTV